MAVTLDQAWSFMLRCEKELQAALRESSPTFDEIENLMSQLRSAGENICLTDFEYACDQKAEPRLWEAHIFINNRFRKLFSRFDRDGSNTRPVERRKLGKHYLDFIKSSQRFYRGYIAKLAAHFDGIPELVIVMKRFSRDATSAARSHHPTDAVKRLILTSCYDTLIHLGDLSRYREEELNGKKPNWAPAVGYYDLAEVISPNSGYSHNQRAIIASADGSHLRITYHLYRALTAKQPHPKARTNLELEFKKILAAWKQGDIDSDNDQEQSKTLTAWFILLHAKCYQGDNFTGHEQLENEVLGQLTVELKERPLESILHKFALINIAAENFAGTRLQERPNDNDNFTSFLSFQRLNVKTFFTLLRIFQSELEQFAPDDADTTIVSEAAHIPNAEKITAVSRRVLPGLRHYSSWLVSNVDFLNAQVGDNTLNTQIKEMWKIYASTLTLLAATFSAKDLPPLEYLLDEDSDTLGFEPFQSGDETTRAFKITRYLTSDGMPKPRYTDEGVHRNHPNIEMLGRIRDLMTDGLQLTLAGKIPIVLDDNARFIYQEEGVPSELLASPNAHAARLAETSVQREDISTMNEARQMQFDNTSLADEGASQSASVAISMNTADMSRMVDKLVGAEDAEPTDAAECSQQLFGPLTPTSKPYTPIAAGFCFAPNTSSTPTLNTATSVQGFVNFVKSPQYIASLSGACHTSRPSLPSILNSAFAPQPEESSPQFHGFLSGPLYSVARCAYGGSHETSDVSEMNSLQQHDPRMGRLMHKSLSQASNEMSSLDASPFSMNTSGVASPWPRQYGNSSRTYIPPNNEAE